VGGGTVRGGNVGTAVVGMGMTVGVSESGKVQADKTIIKLSRNGKTVFLDMANSFLPLHTNN
jgi:hypothetical protein